MRPVTKDFTHLWNDLPIEERKRLIPYSIENHILHLEQTREMVVNGHEFTLRQLDNQISNLKERLGEYRSGKGESK